MSKIPLNRKSDYLTVVVGSYNRLELLKKTIDSVTNGTSCSHEVLVADGGSTDGSVEYLKSRTDITPVLQGKLIGPALAYNDVWRKIESKYTCWLSDDTEIVPGALDRAVDVLNGEPGIGMVGLKMRDTVGRGVQKDYGGAISPLGILNINHGVMPLRVLRAVDFFNEAYRFYYIDPDLTASILCTGKSVVMTKAVEVLHHRADVRKDDMQKQKEAMRAIYLEKFAFLIPGGRNFMGLKKSLLSRITRSRLFRNGGTRPGPFGMNARDVRNLILGRYISFFDAFRNRNRPYHLVQSIPRRKLNVPANPLFDAVEN